MNKVSLISSLLIIFFVTNLIGQVDSEWRGPDRDGIYSGEKLLKKWPAEGPKVLWSFENLGEGYSSAAVTKDRVYATGMTDAKGYLYAFDLKGKLLWKNEYGREWAESYPGARTTPTVVGDRIYLMSAFAEVICLDTNGKNIWSVDLIAKYDARNLRWGFTESLLVDGDRVFCTPGAANAMFMALNRHTGELIWKTKGNGEKSAYCSPRIVKHGSKRIILTMTAESVVGIDAASGEFLWEAEHETKYDINPNTPLYKDGYVCTTSGYGTTGTQMFKLSADGKKINRVWINEAPDVHFGGLVLIDGYLYGSGHREKGWHCLDWKTGKVQYTSNEIGRKGNIIYADGMIYCYSEKGHVAVVKPGPKKFDVVSSFKLEKGSGEDWAHSVIKDGRLYVRHGNVLMVYAISR